MTVTHHVYVKIYVYARPKITTAEPHGGGWFKRELKFLGLFFGLISFSNIILSSNTFALFVPTLSASVDQANLQVNGNQVINSTDKTTEIPFNFTVNTNNRTGYTATLSSETENTALTNVGSAVGVKIDSISTNLALNNLPNNTWGYKFGTSTNYAPIPALSTPAQILQTTGKTNGNESNQLSIGMKLADNLESGNYQNKLILSFISNPYAMRAVMTDGKDFNRKVGSLDIAQLYESNIGLKNNIKYFNSSSTLPPLGVNTVSIESPDSDLEIKAWFIESENTVYYYAAAEKILLNTDCTYMFYYFTNVANLDLAKFDSSEVTTMNGMFFNMKSLESLDLSHFNTHKNTDLAAFLGNASKLKILNLTNFNTENVSDMRAVFYGVESLENIDISSFNTSKVTTMISMFYGMSKLRRLSLANFNTSKVTSMESMFANDSALTELDLSNFNTTSVTDMKNMFRGMRNLISLNISSFDTRNVTDMHAMFALVSSITNLNLANFNTEKVKDMDYMFGDMNALVSLDIANFNTTNLIAVGNMFSIYNNAGDELQRIYIKNDFNISKIVTQLTPFRGRNKLRGGNGSYLANPSDADKTWLRIDRHLAPGYFTLRS